MSYDEHLISMAGGDGEPDLDAIEARAQAATEGPWKAQNLERDHGHCGIYWVSVDRPDEIKTVAEVDANDDGVEAIWRMADAEFIANARTDVPALIAVAREQQAKLDRVEAVHKRRQFNPIADGVHFGQTEFDHNICDYDHERWPCPTIAAITATEDGK